MNSKILLCNQMSVDNESWDLMNSDKVCRPKFLESMCMNIRRKVY